MQYPKHRQTKPSATSMCRVAEGAQWEKVLVAKTGDPSLIPKPHMMEKSNFQKLFSELSMSHMQKNKSMHK